MKQNLIKSNVLWFLALFLVGCSGEGNTNTNVGETPLSSDSAASDLVNNPESQGNLSLVANGEDFVREGFVTKDGWQINFERVAVNVGEVTAYQVESGFDPETEAAINSEIAVPLVKEPQTIDLAMGEATAAPILIQESSAPEGFYNALSWEMLPGIDASLSGEHTILLAGIATKGNRQIDFLIGLNQPTQYICGEFVGDTRKGIVQPNDNAEVEMTFHFDHIFGDGTAEADNELNQKALGFQPLASLATSDELQLSWQDLQANLAPEDYQKLTDAVVGLGHVGEGHCASVALE
ncbi:MAG TPA: DUF4382 domain-containing protein [Xenococcaceae cyanobacterium]